MQRKPDILDAYAKAGGPVPITTACVRCDGSGYVQLDRGCGVWEDRECPDCDGPQQEPEPAPVPKTTMNVDGAAFWAGYRGIAGVNQGIPTSNQRRAWNAGKSRAKAEPGLPLPASIRVAR